MFQIAPLKAGQYFNQRTTAFFLVVIVTVFPLGMSSLNL
jgi:hypothetical protein